MAQRKLEIHALISLSMILELPVYALGAIAAPGTGAGTTAAGTAVEDIAARGEQLGGPWLLAVYPLHVASFCLLVGGFSVYVNQASKVVYLGSRMRSLFWVLLGLNVGLVAVSVTAVAACWRLLAEEQRKRPAEGGFWRFLKSTEFAALGWYGAGALAALSLSFMVVTCMLQRRMWGVLGPGTAARDATPPVAAAGYVSHDMANDGTADDGTADDGAATGGAYGAVPGAAAGVDATAYSPEATRGPQSGQHRRSRSRFWHALCRMNVVMLVCVVSFAARAALFLQLLAVAASSRRAAGGYDDDDNTGGRGEGGGRGTGGNDSNRSGNDGSAGDDSGLAARVAALRVTAGLVMYNSWLPAAVPSLALLYLMRDHSKAGPANPYRPYDVGAAAGRAAFDVNGDGGGDRGWLEQREPSSERSSEWPGGDRGSDGYPDRRGAASPGAVEMTERPASDRSPERVQEYLAAHATAQPASTSFSRRPGQYELVDEEIL